MASNNGPAAITSPLFCGVHADKGAFVKLTVETAVRVPLTADPNGAVILCCEEDAATTAKRVARMYEWAFAPAPEGLEIIMNPPKAEEDEIDEDEGQEDDDDEEDEEEAAPAPAPAPKYKSTAVPKLKAPKVVAAPVPVDDDEDDDWAELDADLGDTEEEAEEEEEGRVPVTVSAGAATVTPGMIAPDVEADAAPMFNKAGNKAARAWAQENKIRQSTGDLVGNAGRLHASIRALYVTTLTPAQRKQIMA